MKKKLVPYSIILIFFVIFFVFYKSLKDTNIYTPEVKINNDIPIFSAELLFSNDKLNSTKIFDLDKFYLLNIWASWCAPCRDCLLYTSPSPRDGNVSRMPSSA